MSFVILHSTFSVLHSANKIPLLYFLEKGDNNVWGELLISTPYLLRLPFLLFQLHPIPWGICAPKQCDEKDLTKLVDIFFPGKVAIVYIETFIFSFMLTKVWCIDLLDYDRWSTGQRAKKVVSDFPGLVYFGELTLPKRQAAKLTFFTPWGAVWFFQLVNNNFNLLWFIILAFLVF